MAHVYHTLANMAFPGNKNFDVSKPWKMARRVVDWELVSCGLVSGRRRPRRLLSGMVLPADLRWPQLTVGSFLNAICSSARTIT